MKTYWVKLISMLALLALYSLPEVVLAQGEPGGVIAGSKAAGLEACVASTPDMRRNHMEYLFHKRDKTMRQGIRTKDFSLNECVSCHAAKDDAGNYIPVTDDEQFCQSCHEHVSQKIDCFQCHRSTPDPRDIKP